MNSIGKIREEIEQEIFDYQVLKQALRAYSKPRDKISSLLASKDLIQIRKGLYCFAPPYRKNSLCLEIAANLIHGPSYISLDYALSYHGLIPERVEVVTSMTTARSRRFDTPLGRFSYQTLGVRRFASGVRRYEGPSQQHFLMASPEKALVDKVWTDKRFSGNRLGEFSEYLTDDLRISSHSLRKLSRELLQEISNDYASRKIANLVHYLQKEFHNE